MRIITNEIDPLSSKTSTVLNNIGKRGGRNIRLVKTSTSINPEYVEACMM